MNNTINKPLIIIGGSGHGCVIEACVMIIVDALMIMNGK